jgi:hypothetical protein
MSGTFSPSTSEVWNALCLHGFDTFTSLFQDIGYLLKEVLRIYEHACFDVEMKITTY